MSTYSDPADDNRDPSDFVVSITADSLLHFQGVCDASLKLLESYYGSKMTPTTPASALSNEAWELMKALGMSLSEIRGEIVDV